MNVLNRMSAVLAMLSLSSGIAIADNPHFNRANASLQGDGDLECSFFIAGLGTNENILVTCSADASAFYACFNKGGNHPQASNKEEAAGPVSETGLFQSGQNGQVRGTLEVDPPDATISCPGNQRLVLCSISYTNILLTGNPATGADFFADVPGTLSRTFVQCF